MFAFIDRGILTDVGNFDLSVFRDRQTFRDSAFLYMGVFSFLVFRMSRFPMALKMHRFLD